VIIIKTNNGDVFVNEKTTHIVEHNREDKTVVIRNPQYKLNSTINDVEGIIYTNDAQPVSWKDEGSEIERLQKKLDEQRELGNKMRDEYLNIEQERDELKARLAELEPKEDPDRWWPDNVEVAPIEVIAGHIERSGYDPGYSVRLGKLFAANDIKTVGDLLRIGRRQFKKYRSVGGGSLSRIDNALEDLYDIKGW
jgi:hypothetical protein